MNSLIYSVADDVSMKASRNVFYVLMPSCFMLHARRQCRIVTADSNADVPICPLKCVHVRQIIDSHLLGDLQQVLEEYIYISGGRYIHDLYDLYDLAHVGGWEPYSLHDLL